MIKRNVFLCMIIFIMLFLNVNTFAQQSNSGFLGKYYYFETKPADAGSFVKEVIDRKIDYYWGYISPDGFDDRRSNVYIEWSGEINLETAGLYNLQFTLANGGFRFYIDGILIKDFWTGDESCCGHSVNVDFSERLPIGKHFILILGTVQSIKSPISHDRETSLAKTI